MGTEQAVARGPGEIWGERSHRHHVRGVSFGVYRPVDIEIEPHVHEDRHLVFVFEGNCITSAQGAPPVSAAPILVDNPAGTAHRDRFLKPAGRFLTINIDPARSSEGVAQASRAPADIARMMRLLDEMEFATSGVLLEEAAEGLSALAAPAEPSTFPLWARRAFELVMDERAEQVTLDALAREAEVHPVHVARTFRRMCGRTAGQLVRERQFERACRRLSDSEEPIAQIALDLGFCDQAHFTRFFGRRAGISPARFRRLRHEVRNIQESLRRRG